MAHVLSFIFGVGLVTTLVGTAGLVAFISLWAIDQVIKAYGFQREIIAWSIDKKRNGRAKG